MKVLARTAAIIFVIDQLTKWLVVQWMNLINRGTIDIWPPYLTFRMAWNRGVNFGLLSNETEATRWGLIILALAISIWVIWWMRQERSNRIALISAGVLVGGAFGNIIDRLWYGAVADFLNMSCCGIENPYVFNVADIAIFAGAIGLVIFTGNARKPRRKKTP